MLTVVAIAGYSMTLVQMNILIQVFRSTLRFAYAMVFSGSVIIVEGVTLLSVALFGYGPAMAGWAMFACRVASYIVFLLILQRRERWVVLGISHANCATIKALAMPSLAALASTLATAASLQGMTLVLAATTNAPVVAAFGAARTLSRVPLQLAGIFLRPALVEVTRAVAENNVRLQNKLVFANVTVSLLVTLPFGMLLIYFGSYAMQVLSNSQLEGAQSLFIPLACAATFNSLWASLTLPLAASNKYATYSYLYLIFSLFSIALFIIGPWQSAAVAATYGMISEGLMLIYILARISTKGFR